MRIGGTTPVPPPLHGYANGLIPTKLVILAIFLPRVITCSDKIFTHTLTSVTFKLYRDNWKTTTKKLLSLHKVESNDMDSHIVGHTFNPCQ